MRAVHASLCAGSRGVNTKPALFPEEAPNKSPNKRFLGVVDIPIPEIIGTVSRQSDFDYKFRPLHKYLRDRWVNTYLTLQKVGESYYVEGGHHRVSVAQALGMAFIQAKVWEYSCRAKEPKKCQIEPEVERSSAQVYAGVTE